MSVISSPSAFLLLLWVSLPLDDDAEDLYMKGILGSVKLYDRFLQKINLNIIGVRQERSFKYVKYIDWTIINDFKLIKFLKLKKMRYYIRSEKIINYSNKKLIISDLYKILLNNIMKK